MLVTNQNLACLAVGDSAVSCVERCSSEMNVRACFKRSLFRPKVVADFCFCLGLKVNFQCHFLEAENLKPMSINLSP